MRHGRQRENRAQAGGRIARAAARAGPARREASRLHALLAPGQKAADAEGLLLSGLPVLPRTDRRIPHAGRPVSGSTGRTLFGCRTRLQQERMVIRGVGDSFLNPTIWGTPVAPYARPRHAGRTVPQARGQGVHDVGPDARRGPTCIPGPGLLRAADAAFPAVHGQRRHGAVARDPRETFMARRLAGDARPEARRTCRVTRSGPVSSRGVPRGTTGRPAWRPATENSPRLRAGAGNAKASLPERRRIPSRRHRRANGGRSPPNCWIQERFSNPTNSHSSTLTPRPAPG